MLIGSYLGVLGEKRRTAIPKRFLEELGGKLVIAKWYEGCLVLVSVNFWEALLDRLTGGSRVASLGVRDIERFILGSAFEVVADGQGRIVIPEILVSFAGLNKELVFLGLGDRAEVWSKEVWEVKAEEIGSSTREFIENLAKNEKR
jgi:MraZ protein